MEGGPPVFPPGSTCPVVLRIPERLFIFRVQDSHLLWSIFPNRSARLPESLCPVLTPKVLLPPVWPLPISLAATLGISFDFSSSAYLDVSVQRVSPYVPMYSVHSDTVLSVPGSPIRKSADITLTYSSPRHIGVSPVLHRLPVPRHPPCALCSLTFVRIALFSVIVVVTLYN